MRKQKWQRIAFFFFLSFLVIPAGAQMGSEDQLDQEVQAVDPLEQEFMAEPPPQTPQKRSTENEVSSDRNFNRFPKQEPLFKRPPGPPEGGAVRVEHPRAAEGLLRVNKDGSYQYRTSLMDKSRSSTVKIGSMSPPKITTSSAVTYETMYGSNDLISVLFDYEWQPFRRFGALGVFLETGLATTSAKGSFKNQDRADGRKNSEERYNFFVIPMSAFLNYRFEYVRRQWIVPFINGGVTYFGLAEVRDDGKRPNFAGAPAVGGGGGLMFSISRLDSAGAYNLSSEYGIADMWFTLEARATQGLYSEIDFSGTSINGGVTVDF